MLWACPQGSAFEIQLPSPAAFALRRGQIENLSLSMAGGLLLACQIQPGVACCSQVVLLKQFFGFPLLPNIVNMILLQPYSLCFQALSTCPHEDILKWWISRSWPQRQMEHISPPLLSITGVNGHLFAELIFEVAAKIVVGADFFK